MKCSWKVAAQRVNFLLIKGFLPFYVLVEKDLNAVIGFDTMEGFVSRTGENITGNN